MNPPEFGRLGATLVPRAIAFLLLFAFMQLAWQTVRGTTAQRVVVHDGTVIPAVLLASIPIAGLLNVGV